MQAISEFLSMGGYGAYVWPSYALAALTLGGMLGFALARLRATRRELKAYDEIYQARRRRRNGQRDG